MSDKPKPITVNTTIYWANLATKNEMSGKYQVDLGNLSEGAVAALQQRGIDAKIKPPKEDAPEMGQFVTCKSVNPIRAYNTAGDEISELVGNGSKAKVALGYYDWRSPAGKSGRSASILKLIVTELEVYDSPDSLDMSMEDAL
jgi:hypothetical protein|tara:strand:+ start:98 stop:526 length:429 start_codon:yes stop_codon:yes gene_type:complete